MTDTTTTVRVSFRRALRLSLYGLALAALVSGCSTTPTQKAELAQPASAQMKFDPEMLKGMTPDELRALARKIDEERRAREVAEMQKDLTPLEEQWGIKILGVSRTAAGYMLDFRYKVLDPVKATPILQRKYARNPYLICERTGAKLGVPFTEKAGSMRSSVRTANQIRAGRNYRAIFVNPARHVKSGDKVTIVIGKFKADHLTVN